MLDKIKKQILDKYKEDEKKGFFATAYDEDGKILASQWVFDTDKELPYLIDDIYYAYIDAHKDKVALLICDVVTNKIQLFDTKDILGTSPKQYWFYLMSQDGSKSGIILPDMAWVADAKNAIYLLKKKYELSGQVLIYSFTTDRMVIKP